MDIVDVTRTEGTTSRGTGVGGGARCDRPRARAEARRGDRAQGGVHQQQGTVASAAAAAAAGDGDDGIGPLVWSSSFSQSVFTQQQQPQNRGYPRREACSSQARALARLGQAARRARQGRPAVKRGQTNRRRSRAQRDTQRLGHAPRQDRQPSRRAISPKREKTGRGQGRGRVRVESRLVSKHQRGGGAPGVIAAGGDRAAEGETCAARPALHPSQPSIHLLSSHHSSESGSSTELWSPIKELPKSREKGTCDQLQGEAKLYLRIRKSRSGSKVARSEK